MNTTTEMWSKRDAELKFQCGTFLFRDFSYYITFLQNILYNNIINYFNNSSSQRNYHKDDQLHVQLHLLIMYSLCWYHTCFFEMCYVLMFTLHLKSLISKLWHANKEPLLGRLVSSENLPNKVMLQNLHESVSHDPGGCWVNHKCWQTQTERECQKRESLFITEISGKWEGIGGDLTTEYIQRLGRDTGYLFWWESRGKARKDTTACCIKFKDVYT